ncbi:MAG: GxxExxY protein [Bacteroidetes bacterium]|nr:GxxExxY protein [Bacteroidota bacterium]
MTFSIVKRDDLLFPDLSFQIVGCAFEVFNELGPGHSEKNYQNALAYIFKLKNIQFK